MILGFGIDAVNIDRLVSWEKNPTILGRFFHPDEIAEVKRKGKRALPSFAARFAAKEAFGKALGTGLRGLTLKDIAVLNDGQGKPYFRLHGTAETALKRWEECVLHVTLTHEHDYAFAAVIIEGKDGRE